MDYPLELVFIAVSDVDRADRWNVQQVTRPSS
jgi:hypothetical protein